MLLNEFPMSRFYDIDLRLRINVYTFIANRQTMRDTCTYLQLIMDAIGLAPYKKHQKGMYFNLRRQKLRKGSS